MMHGASWQLKVNCNKSYWFFKIHNLITGPRHQKTSLPHCNCVRFAVLPETTVMWNELGSSLLTAHKSICIDTQMESVYTLWGLVAWTLQHRVEVPLSVIWLVPTSDCGLKLKYLLYIVLHLVEGTNVVTCYFNTSFRDAFWYLYSYI